MRMALLLIICYHFRINLISNLITRYGELTAQTARRFINTLLRMKLMARNIKEAEAEVVDVARNPKECLIIIYNKSFAPLATLATSKHISISWMGLVRI